MTQYADRGKWAEGQVEDWLKAHSSADARFAYHRFPDARSARGALSAQPSDFMVHWSKDGRRDFCLLEVKETANKGRLPKSKIGQYGKLKLFDIAGATVVVVVYMSDSKEWTHLTAGDLFDHETVPASFKLTNARYPTPKQLLETIFP